MLPLVDCNNLLVGLEVLSILAFWGSHPHTLDTQSRPDRLWCFHVCEYNVTVKLSLIDPTSRSIEVGPTERYTLPRPALAFFPDIYVFLLDLSIEGNDGELGILG